MKKSTTAPRRLRHASASAELPPLVAAIARTLDPGGDGIRDTFLAAWKAAPDIAASYFDCTFESIGKGRYAFIRKQAEAAIARSRTGESAFEQSLFRAMNLLDEADVDYRVDVELAHAEPAFHLGLAIGMYLLMNGGQR